MDEGVVGRSSNPPDGDNEDMAGAGNPRPLRIGAPGMKQVFQDLKTGDTRLTEVPRPSAAPGQLLIRSHASLVSTGTERRAVEFGKAGFIDKARQQPDKVRQVLEKIRTDGLMTTLDAVRAKLDEPLPLGYCNVGTVIGLGAGVQGFVLGERGAGVLARAWPARVRRRWS